jgi:hypothetical protein
MLTNPSVLASKSNTTLNNIMSNSQVPLQQQQQQQQPQQQSFNVQHAQTVQSGLDVFKLLQQKQLQLNAELNMMQNRIVDLNCMMKQQPAALVSIQPQQPQLLGATSPPVQLQQQHPHIYHHAHTVNDLDMLRSQFMPLSSSSQNNNQQHNHQKWTAQQQQQQQHHYMTIAPHSTINVKLANNGANSMHSIASANSRITSPPNHSIFQLNQPPQQIIYQPVVQQQQLVQQQEYSSLPDQSSAYYNLLDSASSSSSLTAQDILAAEQAQLSSASNNNNKPTYASVVATATSAVPSNTGLMTITENVISGQMMTHGQSSSSSMLPLYGHLLNRKISLSLFIVNRSNLKITCQVMVEFVIFRP